MADLVLSFILPTLFHKLSSGILVDYAQFHGISGYLKIWEAKLRVIQAVIDSAAKWQSNDDTEINRWLADLKEVAYDVEDLLDEFKVEAERNASVAKLRSGNIFHSLVAQCFNINPRSLLSDPRMGKQIKEVDRRLEEVFSRAGGLGLLSIICPPCCKILTEDLPTLPPEPKFVGREEQMKELLHRLTRNESTDDSVGPFSVISIVGVGGVGKTVLARELYDHKSLREAFSLKAWTPVSDVFDLFAVTRGLLQQIAPSSLNYMGKDLNSLQVLLREHLLGKKFLIVLDGIQNDKYKELDNLLEPFDSGSRGSRILLTTRKRNVATIFGDHNPMILQGLSLQDSLYLLAYHSIGEGNFEKHPRLQHIADQLAQKHEGLPRSLKKIARQLGSETDEEKWKIALDHDVWNGEDGHDIPTYVSNIPSPGLVGKTPGIDHTISDCPPFLTPSLPEPKFVGREKQMKELLHRLTQIESTDGSFRPFSVISIVGMGGLGKTTLAQELYNHKSLEQAFSLKAWSCVSDVFDQFAITRGLLQQIAPPSLNYENMDLTSLRVLLREQLLGKKFLLVLDDVWNDQNDELENLLKPFNLGSRGSRILLTTRNRRVATIFGDHNPMILQGLSQQDSLSLLAYHSIGEENFKRHPHLQQIAVQLAQKCEGLPTFLKMIGGLLRFEFDEEKWKEALDHGVSNREGRLDIITSVSKLSYIHLPIHLKRCFAACALFPPNYLFDGNELINLWIVQGLLDSETTKTYWDKGVECLGELESRSLLHRVGNEKNQFSMRLVSNLAKSIVGVTCFSYNQHRNASGESPGGHVRHASLLTRYFERCPSSIMDVYRPMTKLRTFMPFQISSYLFSNISVSDKVLHDLIMGMKCLRVLSLRCFQIRLLPDEIGKLKLLRSIDVSYTLVEVLPNSISDLIDLHYLLLQGCKKLKTLPRNIDKLTNLLRLDITGAHRLLEMPPQIGNLTNLEILSTFVVGKNDGQGLKELGPLKGLKRELHICNLQAVGDIEDAKIADLQEKEGILELSFDFRSTAEISRHEGHQLMLLDHLKPPRKIECFKIYGYGGKKFPSWLCNPCMSNVVSITMEDCASVKSLPPLGQLPSLKQLNIGGLDGVSLIEGDFYGSRSPFRSLRSLSFHGMLAWEEWSSFRDNENVQPFPLLRELTMVNCPKLKRGFPGKLELLCKLDIRDCPQLETSGESLGLPSLGEMHFERCNEGLLKCLVGVTSVTKLIIRNVPHLDRFDGSTWVSLEEIQLQNCPRLKPFMHWNGAEQVPPKLKRLVIGDCKRLKKLPDNLCGLESLTEMIITSCRKLSSLPSMGLTSMLRKVELADCLNLPCSQFLGMKLLKSLEELTLKNLQKLEAVEDIIIESHLSLSLGKLNIDDCRGLKTLPDISQHLSSLSELCISHCKELELDCFPDLPCNLSKFQLVECSKVKSLPQNMHVLISLKEVDIRSCARITSLPIRGFPPNLEWLRIASCESLKQPLEDWGLRQLFCLQQLHIVGGMECVDDMACFPCDNNENDYENYWSRLIPPSLVVLDICFMEKLERLASGLKGHLTSLQELRIGYCGKMRHLPDDGLPDSLEVIEISGCDLLVKRCSQPNGRYWSLLQRIPEAIIY